MPSDQSNRASSTLRAIRTVLWVAAFVALAGYAVVKSLERYLLDDGLRPRQSGQADIRSEFTLTEHTGRQVTEADFAGRWQMVFFGFTNCPDVCPTTLAYMASVLDLLGDNAGKVAPLFITVDPARDTAPVMAEYVSVFHPRLIGLTGTDAQIAEATRNFRTWFERTDDASAPDGYFMAHAGHIYLMRPDGSFEAVYLESERPPDALAEEIRRKL